MIEANNVNLNLMKTFIVVAESKSLADAGEKLGYASSSISTSISTLENQLGVQLFTRKPLKLTEIGKEIYESAKLGMRTVDFAVTIAQSKNDMNCAKISIGCPSHITEFYLMERIENAINDYPNMCISIDTESDSRELIEEIRQNKIDFAILNSVPADCKEELVIKELKKTKNIFISNEPIDIKDIKELENYKYVLSYENKTTTKRLGKILNDYDVNLDVVLRCPTTEQRINAAKRGIGIAYVMKEAAKSNLKNKKVYEVKLPIELPENSIKLIYLKDRLTKVDKKFIKDYLN